MFGGRHYPRAVPGSRQLPASTVNRPIDDVERAQKFRTGPGLRQTQIAGAAQVYLDEDVRQMARITGAPTSGKHPWQAVTEMPGGVWSAIPGFTDNSLADPLYEDNANTIPVGKIVEMRKSRYANEWRTQLNTC